MSFSSPASYKKKAGTLESTDNDKTIQWTITGGDKPQVTFPVAGISQVQQSPASSKNNILKVSVTQDGQETSYQFSFSARDQLNSAKDAVQGLFQSFRKAEADAKAKAEEERAKAKAQGEMMKPKQVANMDTKSLLKDFKLQEAFLKENKELQKTFREMVIEGGLPPTDFWSTRISLLRWYAFTTSQSRGRYNVLSTIKPTAGDNNQLNVSLSREKIFDMFEQYPIVRQAYDENVPDTVSEGQFWARFFNSKLYRKLKGEKIGPNDAIDAVLDKYLALDEETGHKRKRDQEESYRVPQYLNVEGNVENSPTTYGNRPDMTMQPGKGGADTISLIQSMNNLSQRMLYSNSKPVDDPRESGLDDELRLQDLGGEDNVSDGVQLSVKERHAQRQDVAEFSVDAFNKSQAQMRQQLNEELDLSTIASNKDDVTASRNQVNDTIRLRAREASQNLDNSEQWGGDKKLFDQIQMCHATSTEFLRHFWIHFLSGDPNQAAGLSKLVPSLQKSIERVDAIVKQGDTPQDREKVSKSLQPLVTSIKIALQRYNEEMAKATASNAGSAVSTPGP